MYSGRAAPGPGNSCTVRFKFSNMTGDGISLCWGPMYVSWVIVIWGPLPTPNGHTDRHTLLKTLPSRNSFRGWSKSWKHKLPTEIMCSNYSKWRKKFCCSSHLHVHYSLFYFIHRHGNNSQNTLSYDEQICTVTESFSRGTVWNHINIT